MQKYFVHSLKPNKETADVIGSHRIAIVFRDGNMVMYGKDSGKPCNSLLPSPARNYFFGSNMKGLYEGKLYMREEMRQKCYHR